MVALSFIHQIGQCRLALKYSMVGWTGTLDQVSHPPNQHHPPHPHHAHSHTETHHHRTRSTPRSPTPTP